MPWLSQESYPLPEEDLLTFAFGNTDYDDDKPVRTTHPLLNRR
jgi:4-coumarate--CoA ligase